MSHVLSQEELLHQTDVEEETAQRLLAELPDASQLFSDEPEMESSLHAAQLMLLVACLERLWQDRTDYFIGSNLTIYYSLQELKQRKFRGPDFFLVKTTEKRPRLSWVVWAEDGKYPDLIIELLSNSTARTDRETKKTLYQDVFRAPEYFWFSPQTLEFLGFRLGETGYQEIVPVPSGKRWSQVLGLYLGIYQGKLRYFTSDETLVPTPEEAELEERRQKELAQQQVQEAEKRIARLEAQLHALGQTPED